MPTMRTHRVDRPALVVGIVLILVALVVVWDASKMTIGSTYGINPTAMPYFVAIFFTALALGHFVVAFRDGLPHPGAIDRSAVGWVSAALIGLIAAIGLGAGFILGSAILFALTARGFGRRALLADFAIGFVLGLLIFFLFNNLLSLTLPHGPIETLL